MESPVLKYIKAREVSQSAFEIKLSEYKKKLFEEYENGFNTSENSEIYITSSIATLEEIVNSKNWGTMTPRDEIEEFKYFWSQRNSNYSLEWCVPKSISDSKVIDFIAKAYTYKELLDRILLDRSADVIPNESSSDSLTTNQKVLILYFLAKHKIINFNRIHQDQTKQSKVFSALLGRDPNNVRIALNQIPKSETNPKYFNTKNLTEILPVLKLTDCESMINEVDNMINNISRK